MGPLSDCHHLLSRCCCSGMGSDWVQRRQLVLSFGIWYRRCVERRKPRPQRYSQQLDCRTDQLWVCTLMKPSSFALFIFPMFYTAHTSASRCVLHGSQTLSTIIGAVAGLSSLLEYSAPSPSSDQGYARHGLSCSSAGYCWGLVWV